MQEKLRVEYWRNEAGMWYWHAKHKRNGKIMVDGAEGYSRKRSLMHGVKTVFPDGVEIVEKQ